MKIIKGFNSLNPIYKVFFITCIISSLLPIYFVFNFVPVMIIGIIFSSITLILIIVYLERFAEKQSSWKSGEIVLIILTFLTVSHLPCHFISASRISFYSEEKKDNLLVIIDNYLLGWLIKDGQISLWIDNNNYIGPHTLIGMFINNLLQICYFFYYIVPYVTMHFINLLNCLREIIFRYQNSGFKSATYKRNWNNTLFLFSVYLLTCVFVFITNTLVPATSPRKYLKGKFKHPLILSGFGRFLNQKCKDDKSANSFPSGHVAEILAIGLAYIATKEYHIASIVIIFSILIGFATVFLRYHYFCDILMAVFLSFLGFWINYYFGYRRYIKEFKDFNHDNVQIVQSSSPDSDKEIVLNEEDNI